MHHVKQWSDAQVWTHSDDALGAADYINGTDEYAAALLLSPNLDGYTVGLWDLNDSQFLGYIAGF